MTIDGYGMTPEGFRAQRKEQITNIVFDDLESKWGKVKRNPESVIGQIVYIIMKPTVQSWLELESLYMGMDPDSADFTRLDNLCKYSSIQRKDKTGTTVICACYGTEGTIIPASSVVSDNSGNLLSAIESAIVTVNSLVHAKLTMDDTTNIILRVITIKSGSFEATFSLSATGDTWSSSFSAWVESQIDLGLLPSGLSAEINDDGLDLLAFGYTSFQIMSMSNVSIEDFGSPGIFINTITGAIPISRGTVVNIVTTVTGFDKVFNWSNGLIGSDIETDVALRVRRRRSKYRGSGNIDAITSSIENGIDGVRSVKCYENEEDVEIDGLKPHSIYVIVDGAEGKNQEIATMIWQKKSTGIATNGSISNNVLDRNGVSRVVYFDRPSIIYAFVSVQITEFENEESLSPDWATQIKTNISNIINQIRIGSDLNANKMSTGVYAVVGIADAVIQVGTSNSPNVNPTNWTYGYIDVSKFERVVLGSNDNITVSEA